MHGIGDERPKIGGKRLEIGDELSVISVERYG